MKPFLFLANVSETELPQFDLNAAKQKTGLSADDILLPICAKVEADLVDFSEIEALELLESMGMRESGLAAVIRAAYQKLGLHSFFTAGEKEVRAWTFREGMRAPACAGVIHTDFEKHFIKADVVHWDKFVELSGWSGAREKGLVRSEGKEYVMKDGDVVIFKTSA